MMGKPQAKQSLVRIAPPSRGIGSDVGLISSSILGRIFDEIMTADNRAQNDQHFDVARRVIAAHARHEHYNGPGNQPKSAVDQFRPPTGQCCYCHRPDLASLHPRLIQPS